MAKSKYYVVWAGRKPGIYTTWAECQKQTTGFSGARFKSFESKAEAEAAYAGEASERAAQASVRSAQGASVASSKASIITNSISVDVGSKGNPGIVEYKGVDTVTGEIIFAHPEIAKGTNNLGEFLAIVHALRWIEENKSDKIVYSDSQTAMLWVKNKAVNTNLARDKSTEEIWFLVDRALDWLRSRSSHAPIFKWNTAEWGEIKADYGRK
ncbi:ribonuclease HI [Paenibacillus phyllosphaerae]|uniref:Ribonuclease H n=1 Tax=Paenibacillus phyllosphaerae TaxID=274593 RepID=A0A7W5AZB5_9BACL|nr:ribonuclease H family protein [Paenibacillus phyllosphaerae]MBB3111234.1 ribonuclease HI [Paenibacillus phyllosphaerae]